MNNPQLKYVPVITVVFGVFLALLGLVTQIIWMSPLGILAGAFLAAVNFLFLVSLITRLLSQQTGGKAWIGLMVLAKMALVLGALWLLISVVQVHFMALLFGYMVLVPAITISGLFNRTQGTPAGV